jgi:hypothetical protein
MHKARQYFFAGIEKAGKPKMTKDNIPISVMKYINNLYRNPW